MDKSTIYAQQYAYSEQTGIKEKYHMENVFRIDIKRLNTLQNRIRP